MHTHAPALAGPGPCRWSTLTVAAALLALSPPAAAKVTASTSYSATETSAGDFASGAYAARSNESGSSLGSIFQGASSTLQCLPNQAQCNSATYARTRCGKLMIKKLWEGDATPCGGLCTGRPANLAECENETWLNSVCGQREQVLMQRQDDCGFPASCPTQPDEPGKPVDPSDPDCEWQCGPAGVSVPHPSQCVEWMRSVDGRQQQNDPGFPGIGVQRVRIPARPAALQEMQDPLDNDGYVTSTVERRDVETLDESAQSLTTDGTGRTYQGMGRRDSVRLANDPGGTEAARYDQERASWDANGVAVASCSEYVYEKYYDYSTFEDEARRRGDSARTRFEVAFDAASNPWAIGTRAINGTPLRRKDGVPNDAQVNFPTNRQQKNPMFATAVHEDPTDRAAQFTSWETGQHKLRYRVGDRVLEADIPRPFSPFTVLIVDDAIDAALREGRANHTFVETWAWHRDKEASIASAGYLDEELLALDKLKDRLLLLLHQRHGMLADYRAAMWDCFGFHGLLPEIGAQLQFEFDTLVNPDPVSDFFRDQDRTRSARAASIGIAFNTPSSLANLSEADVASGPGSTATAMSGTLPGGTMAMGGNLGRRSAAIASSVSSSLADQLTADHVQPDPLQRVMNAALALVAQDEAIEALLVHAASRGCLDLGEGNPCDWSPAYFAQRVEDPFMGAREVEYDRCMDYIARLGFDNVVDTPADRFFVDVGEPPCGYSQLASGHVCDDLSYATNTDQVELYMGCVDKFREDIVTCLDAVMQGGGVTLTPEGTVSLVESSGDADMFGGSAFNLAYDYLAEYGINDLPPPSSPDFCALKPYLHGHFNATAHVLIADISLVHAQGDIGLDPAEPPPQAVLEVLGEQLIGIGPAPLPAPNTFNVIAEETVETGGEIFSVGATFVIVIIPVSIKGGIAGRLGATFTLAAGSGGESGQGCAEGGMLLRARAEPFAAVDAFATASIDAIILEIGIKITVTILEVSFPFTTDLRFVGRLIQGGIDVALQATTSLDVVFKFLGGRFSVFVEVCFFVCEEWEETLFSWDPLTYKITLFSTTFTVPLFPLMELNQSQGG